MTARVGIGYDIHRITPGRALVLGGVTFESDWGLEGHSDADVLLHAIGDALLGAAGLGDLGTHFPPGEARWKDASSVELLAPHRAAMCANIARALAIPPDRVSVKATTNEQLGALGRREGVAAMAVALVER
jgi:2-C-methyl-D-erythritol 2,4-cyclodiphosphate synthase